MEGLMEYLKSKYEHKAIEWKEEQGERKRFSNLYYAMQNGLKTIIGVDDMYIKVAVHLTIAEDERKLQFILEQHK
jgi:arabinogalactan endo-1,4-beta-galactosidase